MWADTRWNDPKWEQQAKADPFKLETLIAWLEKQPGKKAYNYCDISNCLLSQYFQAQGFDAAQTGGHGQLAWGSPRQYAKWPAEWIVIPEDMPRTFGAALERARKLAAA